MYDRQYGYITQGDAYVFDLILSDQTGIRINVNKIYPFTEADAYYEAEKYGRSIGRLPYVLRRDVNRLTINDGYYPWGGSARGEIIVHTEYAEREYDNYWSGSIIDETMIHEAAHTSIDKRVSQGYLYDWQTAV